MSGIVRSFYTQWMDLRADDSTASPWNGFTPATGFDFLAGCVEGARMTIETRNRIGNIEVIGATNFANMATSPTDTGVLLGSSWINSEGLTFPAAMTDLSADADSFQLARFGFNTRLSSGSALGSVQARAKIDVLINPTLQSHEMPWSFLTVDSTTPAFFPVTRWFPAEEMARARGAFEVRNANSTVDVSLGCQATNDPASPGSTTLIGSYASTTGALTFPSGWTSLAVDGATMVRFGYVAKLAGGSTRVFARAAGEIEFIR